MTPTQRTLKELRNRGHRYDIAEHWNHHSRTRRDLFNFIDIVALDPDRGIIGIQATSGSNASTRRRKILNECTRDAIDWIDCGGLIEVWGWRELKIGWEAKIIEITIRDFE